MRLSERSSSPRQAMRPSDATTTTAKKPARAGPMGDSVKECTESSTPERVMKVPRMVSEKVATTSDRFHTCSRPRRCWVAAECR